MSFSSIKSSIQALLLILKIFKSFYIASIGFSAIIISDFKKLNLLDLPFGNEKMEKFANREKKYIKEIKVSSLAIKLGSSLLDFRDEYGMMCYCRETMFDTR